jgi:hypothetical protein
VSALLEWLSAHWGRKEASAALRKEAVKDTPQVRVRVCACVRLFVCLCMGVGERLTACVCVYVRVCLRASFRAGCVWFFFLF